MLLRHVVRLTARFFSLLCMAAGVTVVVWKRLLILIDKLLNEDNLYSSYIIVLFFV